MAGTSAARRPIIESSAPDTQYHAGRLSYRSSGHDLPREALIPDAQLHERCPATTPPHGDQPSVGIPPTAL